MQKLTLSSDNASLQFRVHFGINGDFNVNRIIDRNTQETEYFELYGQTIEKGVSYFYDLEGMRVEAGA